jgi:hypothetical protein
MKLRLDLLQYLTDEDVLEEALANNHRHKSEPNFSKAAAAGRSPASWEERQHEEARQAARTQRAVRRLRRSERENGAESSPLTEL